VPEISLVVSTCRRPRDLAACLDSVCRARGREFADFEVVVVDDGGRAEPQRRKGDLEVRWISLPRNLGQPAAQAAGAAVARGEILAFLDDDAEVAPDWVSAIHAYFGEHPDMSAVVGRVLPLDPEHLLSRMRQQVYERRHRSYLEPEFRTRLAERLSLAAVSAPLLSDHLSGGNCAVRRRVYRELAPQGPEPRRGGDRRLTSRLFAAGYALGYDPRMLIYHRHFHGYRFLARNSVEVGRSQAAARLAGSAWPRAVASVCARLARAPFRIFGQQHLARADPSFAKVYLAYLGILLLESAGEIDYLWRRSLPQER
jgi:GT2 family glycosyltransferase